MAFGFISRLKEIVFGPRLIRIFQQESTGRRSLGRDYEINTYEWLGESFIRTVSYAMSAVYYCTPMIAYHFYRKGITIDQSLYYIKVFVGIYIGVSLAYLLRGCGRYQNSTYMNFQKILSTAQKDKNKRDELQLFDFEFLSWPVDFSWKESAIKSSIEWSFDEEDNKKLSFLNSLARKPVDFIEYCLGHYIARPMAFPGSIKLLQAAMGPMLTQGRTGLLEKNGLRAKLLTKDGNEIDTMFMDRRNDRSGDNGNSLVITCEGNAAFYESGIMGTPLKAGYSVLGWNHPGFLGSTGLPFPSQERNAMDVVIQYAVTRLGFTVDNIIMYAWSIGGYTASYATMMYPDIKALVLDATFDNIHKLAETRMPTFASGLVSNVIDKYMGLSNDRQLVKYSGPILLIRRQREEIITTTPGDPSTNRGNFLLIKLLMYRYPKIISKEGVRNLVNFLSATSDVEQARIIESIGGFDEEECERKLSVKTKKITYPLEIGGDFTENEKTKLTMYLEKGTSQDVGVTKSVKKHIIYKMIEEEICAENELNEGEMKQFNLGPGKVLLTKYNGQISAVSAKCTHYGAPLATGAFKDGRVRCPWHGACFNTVTGDIEDFPGLDSLHRYEVNIRNGKVFVKADEESLSNFRRIKNNIGGCIAKNETYLIIGSGSAAITCAETLRQEGFAGEIIMTTQENHVPYDRTKLSKMLNTEASKLYLRDEEFLAKKKITMKYNKKAVNVADNMVEFEDGSKESFTKLFIATGGKPRVLSIPGSSLKNIFYLRCPEDANSIRKEIKPSKQLPVQNNESQGKNVVVLGTGFIGMEIAGYLIGKAKSVTVVGSGRTKVPFEKLLGHRVGTMYMKLHSEKGVKFHLETPAKEITGANGKVSGVILSDGTVLAADVVLSGIGVVPSTEFMKSTQAKMNKAGHLIVDKVYIKQICDGPWEKSRFHDVNVKVQHMKVYENVYAGGDVVSFPYHYDNDVMINIGHWQLAAAHGRCAALNMVGKVTPCKSVPFFWTGQYGKSLRYTGYCSSYDNIIYKGNVEELKFVAYYCRDGKVHACASLNMGAKTSEFAFLIQDSCCPTPEQLGQQLQDQIVASDLPKPVNEIDGTNKDASRATLQNTRSFSYHYALAVGIACVAVVYIYFKR